MGSRPEHLGCESIDKQPNLPVQGCPLIALGYFGLGAQQEA